MQPSINILMKPKATENFVFITTKQLRKYRLLFVTIFLGKLITTDFSTYSSSDLRHLTTEKMKISSDFGSGISLHSVRFRNAMNIRTFFQ